MLTYKDKVVVITGGGTGIGLSFSKQFGRDGAKIVVADMDASKNDAAIAALSSENIEAASFTCNVNDRTQVEALAEFAWEKFGKADVLVNNAGIIQDPYSVIDAPRADIENVLETNFYGVWNGASVFGKRFIAQGTPAAIYNLGSENSFFNAVPHAFAYIVSKHAVLAMTDALREETPDFIEVALICPGLVTTDMTASIGAGMNVDDFTSTAMKQLKAGKFIVVSHPYNIERIDERYDEIREAYSEFAPRYDGDDEFDVRKMLAETN